MAQAQLAQLAVQEQGQHRQLAMLRTELGQVRAGIATRDAQVRLGRETADRYREVAASGYVSVVQVRQQEQAMLEMLNARQVLEFGRGGQKFGCVQPAHGDFRIRLGRGG